MKMLIYVKTVWKLVLSWQAVKLLMANGVTPAIFIIVSREWLLDNNGPADHNIV